MADESVTSLEIQIFLSLVQLLHCLVLMVIGLV